MKKNTIICTILISVLLVISLCGAVYAFDNVSLETQVLNDAIKAGDVCAPHLVKDCEECNTEKASYRTICPLCEKDMVRACDDHFYKDSSEPNRITCYVNDHPDGCETVQSLCWNYYVCDDCEYVQRGYRSDDWHVEAYDHPLCNHSIKCSDNAYCSLKRVDTYRDEWAARKNASAERTEVVSATVESIWTKDFDEAIAAGDYCEVHEIFACDIPH